MVEPLAKKVWCLVKLLCFFFNDQTREVSAKIKKQKKNRVLLYLGRLDFKILYLSLHFWTHSVQKYHCVSFFLSEKSGQFKHPCKGAYDRKATVQFNSHAMGGLCWAFYAAVLLASERSEQDTIRGVQIRDGAVYICMEVRMP